MHDASLYRDKYYLYFGPAPAVLVFAPYFALTHHYFPQKIAVALFCSLGFVLATQLFLMILRDYFPETPIWLKLACVLSLGLANTCPFFIRRPDVYETAIGCAYCLLQLAFLSFYCVIRRRHRMTLWLLLASTSLGAVVGARANYSLIVFMFVGYLVWLWWQKRAAREPRPWTIFWALAPVAVIGLMLAWYNYARFDNPFEFGQRYQLAGVKMSEAAPTHLADLPYSLWYYFLSPPHFSCDFPFIRALPVGRIERPDHSYALESVTGLFISAPVSLLVLALPLLWFKYTGPENRPLLLITASLLLASFVIFLSILPVPCPTMRYFVDFCPGLIVLGCLMACYFYKTVRKQTAPIRWLAGIGLFLLLMSGCVTGLFLSFTGYYNYLQTGSPDTYAAVAQFFNPLEAFLKTMTNSN